MNKKWKGKGVCRLNAPKKPTLVGWYQMAEECPIKNIGFNKTKFWGFWSRWISNEKRQECQVCCPQTITEGTRQYGNNGCGKMLILFNTSNIQFNLLLGLDDRKNIRLKLDHDSNFLQVLPSELHYILGIFNHTIQDADEKMGDGEVFEILKNPPFNVVPSKGVFTNYIDKFLAFFEHIPTFVYPAFSFIKVDNFWLTTHLFM